MKKEKRTVYKNGEKTLRRKEQEKNNWVKINKEIMKKYSKYRLIEQTIGKGNQDVSLKH